MAEEVMYDERVDTSKSPFWTRDNPDGGPYFLVVGKLMPLGYERLRVPWGWEQVYPMSPLCLPHGDRDEILKEVETKGDLYVIAKNLRRMSPEDQAEYFKPVLEKLKDRHALIQKGQIVLGSALMDEPTEIRCPKCKLTHATMFCPICGIDLDKVREEAKKVTPVDMGDEAPKQPSDKPKSPKKSTSKKKSKGGKK